jgi:hypothetical protein
VLVGIGLLIAAVRLSQVEQVAWIAVLAAGLFGASVSSMAIVAIQRWAMPVPKVIRPMVHVVVDRTVSDVPLSLGAYVQGEEGEGYGLFEQWIPRLGFFTSRRSGADAFSGDALVILCPNRSVTKRFRDRLLHFVNSGGDVLVVDSPDNVGSTANSLLWLFGMGVNHARAPEGTLKMQPDLPGFPIEVACQITGGRPFAWLEDVPVGATTRHGKGSVTAIGFGSALNDANMGMTWMQEPDDETRKRYDVLFAVLRAAVPKKAPQPAVAQPAPDGK